MKSRTVACLVSAVLCTTIGLSWQFLNVRYNYQGNWTSLFRTGSNFPVPQSLAWENVYVFSASTGYDGQFYHYMAHDPLLRDGMSGFIDLPRQRYRRILLPGLANLLAFGNPSRIDGSFIAANLLFLFLGAWWLARYLDAAGRSPMWAILLCLAPAALISLDRLTIDLSLTALVVGAALYAKLDLGWKLYIVLALACLSRETGLVLAIAFCIERAARGRFGQAMLFSTAALPSLLWYAFVNSRTPPLGRSLWPDLIPFQGIVGTLLQPVSYPFTTGINIVVTVLDYAVIVGLLLAFGLSVWLVRQRHLGFLEIALILWTLTGLCLPRIFWQDCCSSGRVFSPLLVLLPLQKLAMSGVAALPLALVAPRTWLQLFSELLGILRG